MQNGCLHSGLKPMQACKLGLAGSDASACTPSTSIASGAAASGAAAAAAAAAGLAAHCTRILCCWLCWGLAAEAKHALLAMFGSLACLPFPSALLSMLIPVKPIAELPFTTHHWAFQVVHNDISNGMLSSKFRHKSRHNSSTVPPDTSKRVPIDSS